MAKSVLDKAVEKAALIVVGEVTRKFSKNVLGFVDEHVKGKKKSQRLKKNTSADENGEEVID